jgi:transposase-like protein
MASFRLVPHGYAPDEVDARIEELERELAELRAEGGPGRGAIEAVGHQIEEVQAQARSQATRIRMKALKEAAEIGERVAQLAKRAGLDPGMLLEFRRETRAFEERLQAPATPNAVDAAEDSGEALFQGKVEIDVGPFADFAQLTRFEDAIERLHGVEEVRMERFSQSRATLAVRLSGELDLPAELGPVAPFAFRVREVSVGRLALDVGEGLAEAA